MPGKVKWFDKKKGFGFITDDSITDDVFVHYSDIDGEGFRYLTEGDEVEYDLVQGPKGFQAKRVTMCVVE